MDEPKQEEWKEKVFFLGKEKQGGCILAGEKQTDENPGKMLVDEPDHAKRKNFKDRVGKESEMEGPRVDTIMASVNHGKLPVDEPQQEETKGQVFFLEK